MIEANEISIGPRRNQVKFNILGLLSGEKEPYSFINSAPTGFSCFPTPSSVPIGIPFSGH